MPLATGRWDSGTDPPFPGPIDASALPFRPRPLRFLLTPHVSHVYRADDLIPEEDENVQLALGRMSEKDRYDRIFRIRRAVQCSISHKLLPKAEWTKAEEDTPYLGPLIKVIEAEEKERAALDTMTVHKKH